LLMMLGPSGAGAVMSPAFKRGVFMTAGPDVLR
jgi:hypothetical protein